MHINPSVEEQFINAVTQQADLDYDQKLAVGEKKDKFDDHKRATSYKRHLHNVVVVGMYLLGIIVLGLISIRAWHLATPPRLQWLTDGQLHSVDAVLFSSIIFSLASKYFAYYKLFDRQSH